MRRGAIISERRLIERRGGTDTPVRVIELRLAPRPEAVPRARRALEGLTAMMSAASLEDARLLVSELVTNSIRHGDLSSHERIEVRVDVGEGALRVEVRDPGGGFELHPRTAESREDVGWGLYLVERLADRWGVDRDGSTLVWFELPLHRDAEDAASPA